MRRDRTATKGAAVRIPIMGTGKRGLVLVAFVAALVITPFGGVGAVAPPSLSLVPTATELNFEGPSPGVHGEPQRFFAIVRYLSSDPIVLQGTAPISGTVTLEQNGVVVASAPVQHDFVANFELPSMDAGSHTLSATYHGNELLAPSTSRSITVPINRARPRPTLTIDPRPSVYGEEVQLTSVVPPTGNGRQPTGSVRFGRAADLGQGLLDSAGIATLATRAMTVGNVLTCAYYSGDDNYLAGDACISSVVTPGSAEVKGASSPNPATASDEITITAEVTGLGPATPTGSVSFRKGDDPLGTATLDGAGRGMISVSGLPHGTYEILVEYSGDTNYGGASGIVTQVVGPRIWVGGHGDRWSTPENWSPVGAPRGGDFLTFPDRPNARTSVNDITQLTLSGIAQTGGSHEILPAGSPTSLWLAPGAGLRVANGGRLVVKSNTYLQDGFHTFSTEGDGSITFDGVVAGPGSIEKDGDGTLELSARNTYEGRTTVQHGTLSVVGTRPLGDIGQPTEIAEEARLKVRDLGNPSLSEDLILHGAGPQGLPSVDGFLNTTGDVELFGTVVFEGGGILYGLVSGDGAIVSRSGNLTLNQRSTFTGGISIDAGTLTGSYSGAFGPGPIALGAGTSLYLNSDPGGQSTHDNVITAAEGVTISGAGFRLTGEVTISDTLAIASNYGYDIELAGPIRGRGGLRISGEADVWIAGREANTYSGSTEVLDSAVILSKPPGVNAIPGNLVITGRERNGVWYSGAIVLLADEQIADDANVSLVAPAQGWQPDPLFVLNGFWETVGNLSNAGEVSLGIESDGVDGPYFSTLWTYDLYVHDAKGELTLKLGQTADGPISDVVVVDGEVRIGGSLLNVTSASVAPIGTQFVIIDNDGTDPVVGTFRYREEGTIFGAGGNYRISYVGGDGNDVTLTRVS